MDYTDDFSGVISRLAEVEELRTAKRQSLDYLAKKLAVTREPIFVKMRQRLQRSWKQELQALDLEAAQLHEKLHALRQEHVDLPLGTDTLQLGMLRGKLQALKMGAGRLKARAGASTFTNSVRAEQLRAVESEIGYYEGLIARLEAIQLDAMQEEAAAPDS